MKLKLALLTAAMLLPLASPVNAFHSISGATCDGTGATAAMDLGGSGAFAIAGTVDPSNDEQPGFTPVKWSLTLVPGEHYAVGAQVGDVDFAVCKPGEPSNRHACIMGNVAFTPESCLLSVNNNPGSGAPLQCAGPANCDFVVYVYYCFGVFCYGLPADPPELAYAIVFY